MINTETIKGAIVLIVDDSPTNLSVLFKYLSEMGLKVLVAQSGESALEQITYERPDIILLDVLMPDMDGFETCRRLKAHESTREIPVIFMTALSDKENIVAAFEVGAVDYIPKPFHQEEVLARLATHLTLQRQRMELYTLNATKNKFFSIVAHELKEAFATLVSLSNYLVLVLPGGDDTNIHKAAEMAESSVQHTVKLLENLLNWGKIQNGEMEFHPQLIDLQKIVLEQIMLFRGLVREKQIALAHTIPAPLMVYTDQNTAGMVLRNLLSNAIWFTPQGGEVTVSAKVTDGFVAIVVADTGIGISPQHLAKLFRIDQKFKRKGTAGEYGTGLGLILSKELIEMNGGQIWIESEVERGTTVTFTLPREKI